MRRLIVLTILLIILASCGGLADTTQTPEAVHARWVAAIRANDRTSAMAVVSAELSEQELFVDQALRSMQDLMTAPSSPTGALQRALLQPPIDQGQAKRAISVWHFAQKTWCYATNLSVSDSGWRVVDWGQIAHCRS